MSDRIQLTESEQQEATLLANYLLGALLSEISGIRTEIRLQDFAGELIALRALLRECRRHHRRLPMQVARVLNRFPTHSPALRLRQAEADRREQHDDR